MRIAVIIICVILNSVLGYFVAILDIYIHQKSFEANWVLRPWSRFLLRGKIDYNMSVGYIVSMSIFGPFPKMILNLFFGFFIIMPYLYVLYGFLYIYLKNCPSHIIPIPKFIQIKKKETISARDAYQKMMRLVNENDFIVSDPEVHVIAAIATLVTLFAIVVILHDVLHVL